MCIALEYINLLGGIPHIIMFMSTCFGPLVFQSGTIIDITTVELVYDIAEGVPELYPMRSSNKSLCLTK